MQKLNDRKIPTLLNQWIKSFLSDRTLSVVIQKQSSKIRRVTSGVPQGSILGPLLFLLYTDDVDNILCDLIKLYKFADDMKLYYIFYPKESETDAHKPLQQCIDTLYG